MYSGKRINSSVSSSLPFSKTTRFAPLALLFLGLQCGGSINSGGSVPLVEQEPSIQELERMANEALNLGSSSVVSLQVGSSLSDAMQLSLPIEGVNYTLVLSPTSVRKETNLRIKNADGSMSFMTMPQARTFRGEILELEGSSAAASLLPDGLYGIVELPGNRRYGFEPLRARVSRARADQYAIYDANNVVPSGGVCLQTADSNPPGGGGGGSALGLGGMQVAEMAIDCDFQFFQARGSNVATVINEVENIINTMNLQYENEVGITHVIIDIVVRTSAAANPYTTDNANALLDQFEAHWNTDPILSQINHDLAHLFTGRNIFADGVGSGVIGIASLNAVCNSFNYGLVETECCSSLACRTDLSAHEIGHNWGANHCTPCADTTMHSPLQCANTFAASSISAIESFLATRSCLDSLPCPFNLPPEADAGPNKTANVGQSISFSASGSTDESALINYLWDFGDGSNASGISVSHSYAAAGNYNVVLQVQDDCGAFDSDAAVASIGTAPPTNQPPTVDAGPARTVTLPAMASLDGLVTDDGLPNPPGFVTKLWTKQTGPGNVTFGNAALEDTTASFSQSGTYVLRLSGDDDGVGSNPAVTDTVTITVNPAAPANMPPSVDAGPAQIITLPATASLNGTITDDGLPNPPGAVTRMWSQIDGPGPMSFGNASAEDTTASFDFAGVYVLQLSADDDGAGPNAAVSDTVQITVNDAPPTNQAPSVDASPENQTITLPASASLSATATDDGLPNPPGALTRSWSKVSGPGNITFSSPSGLSTTASFSAAGAYVIRFQASDSALSANDDINVTVNAAPPTNQAPVVDASPENQTITLPASASLSATASDDNLPSPPAALTLSWSKISGPGNVTFSTPNALGTLASFSAAGSYVLRFQASDSLLSANDDINVTVSAGSGNLDANFTQARLVGPSQYLAFNPASEILELGDELQLNASSSSGNISAFQWQFGDGMSATGSIVEHKFMSAGSFTMRLTVSNNSGEQAIEERVVQVAASMSLGQSMPLFGNNAQDIAIDGDTAWISYANWVLSKVNVSNPASMQVLGNTTLNHSSVAVAASNGHVFLCGGAFGGIKIYSGAGAQAQLVGSYTASGAQDAQAIDKVLFVAGWASGLRILNINNPAAPVLIGSAVLSNGATAEAILVADGIAYIADNSNKIYLFDISALNTASPSAISPVLVKTLTMPGRIRRMSASGDLLVAQAYSGAMSYVINVSDPANASQISSIDMAAISGGPVPQGILVNEGKLYAGFSSVLNLGTAAARINLIEPAEPYLMEFFSGASNNVLGTLKNPILHNGHVIFANSMYMATSIAIPE